MRATARIGGAELASAVRQVLPSAATGAVREEFPVLGCVLVELNGNEVRLVATDRYRMAVRELRPRMIEGEPCAVAVRADELRDVAARALRVPEVEVEIDSRGVRFRTEGACWAATPVEESFPAYRMVVHGLGAVRSRVIVDRPALIAALAGTEGTVVLRAAGDRVVVSGPGPSRESDGGGAALRAICTGEPLRSAFDPGVLVPALDAGVGPDVLLEFSSEVEPVLLRGADQGRFTTCVMPRREAAD